MEGSLDSAVDAACVDQLLRHSLAAGTDHRSPAHNHCRNHYVRNRLAHIGHIGHTVLEVDIAVVEALARKLAQVVGQHDRYRDVEGPGNTLDRMPF